MRSGLRRWLLRTLVSCHWQQRHLLIEDVLILGLSRRLLRIDDRALRLFDDHGLSRVALHLSSGREVQFLDMHCVLVQVG